MVIIWQVAFIAYKMICKIKHKYTSIDILFTKQCSTIDVIFTSCLTLSYPPCPFNPEQLAK